MLRNIKCVLPPEDLEKNKEEIQKSLQLRKSKEGEVVMQSTEILAVLPPLGDLDIRKIPGFELPQEIAAEKHDFVPLSEIEVTIKAHWFSAAEKQADGTKEANIFLTQNGTFELVTPMDVLTFPTVDVTSISPADLESYGVTLLDQKNPTIEKYNTLKDKNLYFITYDYSADHLSKFTLQPELGGGWFVEYHDHPHVFKPMSTQCHGATVIGKLVSEDKETKIGTYKFISIRIGFPNTVALKGGVIHGNAAFVGPYAISTNPNTHASVAIVRKPNGEQQPIAQPEYTSCLRKLSVFSAEKTTSSESLQHMQKQEAKFNH